MAEGRKTKIYERHIEFGGDIINFNGFLLPLKYTSIIDEHLTVRKAVGVFDVSHMGEFLIEGKDAPSFVDWLITNNVKTIPTKRVVYSPMCLENGGIVDDLLCYRLSDERYMLVVNAANTIKDREWIKSHLKDNIKFTDISDDITLLAVQGPESMNVMKKITTKMDIDNLKYYWFDWGKVAGEPVMVSRTGYTGELGYEVYILPDANAIKIYDAIFEVGRDYGIKPIGLGARDTLRLEKKLCLYGNDIDETTTPLEATIGWTVKFEKDFIGKKVLVKQNEEGLTRQLVGFKMIGKGIPRHGYDIYVNGVKAGYVTSGTHSPSLGEPIGLGYVPIESSSIGSKIEIDIRNRLVEAEVCETPFV
ncbi:MAG: glycine cleavage system aminomethyltransferase GcvT [bacterium]